MTSISSSKACNFIQIIDKEKGKLNNDYSNLFINFFLYNDNGRWSINPKKPKDKDDYYNKLACDLIADQVEVVKIPNTELFIKNFNNKRTRLKRTKDLDTKINKILFNSKDENYSWLSNFYPTLIFDHNLKAIFYSVENAYQAIKFKKSNPALYENIRFSTSPLNAKKSINGIFDSKFV